MAQKDIRWEQRFANYNKALQKVSEVIARLDLELEDEELDELLSELEKEGFIQRFEYTYELAWNVMKDYLGYQGNSEIKGSRDAIREAFKINLINNGEVWMDMIKSRIDTSHTYNEETAQEIFVSIVRFYYPAFVEFQQRMEEIRSGSQGEIFTNDL